MTSHTMPLPDTSGHAQPHQVLSDPDSHTMTIEAVARALADAGVPRSERQIKRYCETGLLDATKISGAAGAQWYVAPASLPGAIGDLKQWQAQRERRGTYADMSNPVLPIPPLNSNPVLSTPVQPQPAMSVPVPPRQTAGDDIFEHPYVLKLEQQIAKLETKLDAQIKRTHDIETAARDQLITLIQNSQVAQSGILADTWIKAKQLFGVETKSPTVGEV